MAHRFPGRFARVVVLVSAAAAASALPVHLDLLEDRAEIDRDMAYSPTPSALWLERASVQGELRLWQGALDDLDRALAAGAPPYEVHCGRAEAHFAQGSFRLSETAATLALNVKPAGHRALVLRAQARLASGNYVAAADDFGEALESVPRRPLDLVCAHAAALALGGGDPEEPGGRQAALMALDAAIRERGPLPSLMLMALEHERTLGDHPAALARLERLRRTGWSAVQFELLRGDVLRDSGEKALAKKAWRKALDALNQIPNRRRTTRAAQHTRSELLARIGGH